MNDKPVCAARGGCGPESRHADRPACDRGMQALSGVMAITGEPGGPPPGTGHSAKGKSARMMGAMELLARAV